MPDSWFPIAFPQRTRTARQPRIVEVWTADHCASRDERAPVGVASSSRWDSDPKETLVASRPPTRRRQPKAGGANTGRPSHPPARVQARGRLRRRRMGVDDSLRRVPALTCSTTPAKYDSVEASRRVERRPTGVSHPHQPFIPDVETPHSGPGRRLREVANGRYGAGASDPLFPKIPPAHGGGICRGVAAAGTPWTIFSPRRLADLTQHASDILWFTLPDSDDPRDSRGPALFLRRAG